MNNQIEKFAANPNYNMELLKIFIKKCFYLTVFVVLAIPSFAPGYQSGGCTSGSFTLNFSGAIFVTGLGWNTGASRTISFAGSCSSCNVGPIIYGWGTNPLVEYYIGRNGGTNAGSYNTSKGTYTLYTNSCSGPNITGEGPFTQYNCYGSSSSGQPMGEHYNGWSSLGKGTNPAGGYCVVMVERWISGSGSAVVSVAGSNWYTHWVASGTANFTCGGGNTLPAQASSPSPANGATGVSTSATLSWTAGSGATSHDVYFGTSSPGTYRGNQTTTTYNPGTLTSNTTYYWRIDEKNAAGTTTGNVWSFTTAALPPTKASIPSPAAGATNVDLEINLIWSAGLGATSHDVYFGHNNPPSFRQNQTGTTYYPGTLAYNTTYYWRIDEKNAAGTTTGDLWTFTTRPPQTCAEVQQAGYGLSSDLDTDCYVDYYDLQIIADSWLRDDCSDLNEWCNWADWLTQDGFVDFAELNVLGQEWMLCNNPQDPNCSPNL